MAWEYLSSPPFTWRHVLAAHYLKEFDTIIEIGSLHQPIDRYLTHEFKKCLCVDPLMEPFKGEKSEHLSCDYREVNFDPYLGSFALVLMGLGLPVDEKLFALVNAAKLIVIDFATDFPPAQILFQLICDFTVQKVVFKMRCDLSGNHFGDPSPHFPVYPLREFYVLKPQGVAKQ